MNGKNSLKTVYSFCLIGAVLCFVCAVDSSSCSAQGYYHGYSSNGYNSGYPSGYNSGYPSGYNSGYPSGYYDEEDELRAYREAGSKAAKCTAFLIICLGYGIYYYFKKKKEKEEEEE